MDTRILVDIGTQEDSRTLEYIRPQVNTKAPEEYQANLWTLGPRRVLGPQVDIRPQVDTVLQVYINPCLTPRPQTDTRRR